MHNLVNIIQVNNKIGRPGPGRSQYFFPRFSLFVFLPNILIIYNYFTVWRSCQFSNYFTKSSHSFFLKLGKLDKEVILLRILLITSLMIHRIGQHKVLSHGTKYYNKHISNLDTKRIFESSSHWKHKIIPSF